MIASSPEGPVAHPPWQVAGPEAARADRAARVGLEVVEEEVEAVKVVKDLEADSEVSLEAEAGPLLAPVTRVTSWAIRLDVKV
jgi:hypothetical protein